MLSRLILVSQEKPFLLGITSDWAVIAATAVICGAVLSTSLWISVLKDNHRRRIQAKLGRWLRRSDL
jgi:hypothetical protein